MTETATGIEWSGIPVQVSLHELAARGRIRRSRKLDILDERRGLYREAYEDLNQRLLNGAIEPDEWMRRMMGEVKGLHISAYVAGRSGRWNDMTPQDWGRVGATVQRQYRYLRAWASKIRRAAREDQLPSLAKLNQRAALYGEAASESFEKGYAAEIGVNLDVLPAWPGDGTTECLVNCKCRWAIKILSIDRGNYDARWRLGSAEHCRTCRQRARSWNPLRIRGNQLPEGYEPIFD